MNTTDSITSVLNDAQQQAVTADAKQVLVLAGAGSGKTRVLAHRIAWLIQQYHFTTQQILAVTFTNKAAREMRSRIESLIGHKPYSMWVGTFHGTALRFLRAHPTDANLPEHFQVCDSDDQLSIIKRLLKELKIDDEQFPPRQCQWFINSQKEQARRADNANLAHDDNFHMTMLNIYRHYEDWCDRTGVVDFAELLLRAYETLRAKPELLRHYQDRFRGILIDEFQDTNYLQYAWIRLLTGSENWLFVVGDDDQSIYSWRGAKIENIHRFSKDYPDSLTVRLEQNYRSTQTILSAANKLIAKNNNRLGKELWTELGEGEPIFVYNGYNESEEARFICDRIKIWLNEGNPANEAAILYRSNAQSRVLEEQLLHAGIMYRIYGGLRFFERAEIKNALAYGRLMLNRDDDAAFERIVNMPTRGIGERAMTTLRELASTEKYSLWQAAEVMITQQLLPTRATNAVKQFLDLIKNMAEEMFAQALPQQMQMILQQSGLMQHYQQEKTEKDRTRVENLHELLSACAEFQPQDELEAKTPLAAFINQASLDADPKDNGVANEDCVQLMTMHAAKGLEFSLVFISGLESGLFPHYMSSESAAGLEEERRLFYVGITRAKQVLYLTYADSRRLHGTERINQPSSFLGELPKNLLKPVRMQARVTPPSFYQQMSSYRPTVTAADDQQFPIGCRVQHPVFGEGIVTNYEGRGNHARVQVEFNRSGSKWLVATYAKLQAI